MKSTAQSKLREAKIVVLAPAKGTCLDPCFDTVGVLVKNLKLRNLTPSLLALFLAAGACGSDDKVPLPPDYDPTLNVPLWVDEARIAGADLDSEMLETEIDALLLERQAQNASVLEIDTRLSDYLTDAEFEKEAAFLKVVAQKNACPRHEGSHLLPVSRSAHRQRRDGRALDVQRTTQSGFKRALTAPQTCFTATRSTGSRRAPRAPGCHPTPATKITS